MTTDKRNKTGGEMKAEVLEKITKFSEANKPFAKRMHDLIMKADPSLQPRLWYGMPGYAKSKDSAVLLFFREDEYMTFGLTESVKFTSRNEVDNLLMPCAWFFTKLNKPTEKIISDIVRSAIGD